MMTTPLSTIVEPMAELLSVRRNERVVRITTDNAEACVYTEAGKRYAASAVVVTVPLPVLQVRRQRADVVCANLGKLMKRIYCFADAE